MVRNLSRPNVREAMLTKLHGDDICSTYTSVTKDPTKQWEAMKLCRANRTAGPTAFVAINL
ncbi:hypothetical protein FRC10_003966, partial [Ceratobasidium sp. 414]